MDKHNKILKRERNFLKNTHLTYKIAGSPQNRVMRELVVRTFDAFIDRTGIGLQLGCADGCETEMLAKRLKKLDVVDGNIKFLEDAKQRNLLNVDFIYSLFEEYKVTNKKYDFVFATYVLEHVLNVEVVLKMVKSVLKPNGLLFVVVPNARSLSRQLALNMGLINNLQTLTQNDLDHGHRRVYNRFSLNKDIEQCGFTTISQGGIMLKILADFQMDKLIELGILQNSQIEGLYRLGLEYPDLCGSLFSICKIG